MDRVSVFIGGPITHAWDGHHFDPGIRRLVEAAIEVVRAAGLSLLSPHVEEDFGRSIPEDSSRIVERDLAWIREAQAAIILLPSAGGEPLPTPGTHLELGVLLALEKPVLVLWDEEIASRYNHLVRGLADRPAFRFLDLATLRDRPEAIHRALADMLE